MASGQLLPAGYLSTDGNQIVDQSGNDVRIASVGWNQNFTNIDANVAQIAAAGFNCIRLSWVDATLSGDLSRIQQIVAAASANGIKVILDHHTDETGTPADGYGAQQKNGLWYDTGPGTDGSNGAGVAGTVSAAQFQADWVKVAQTFAGNATVIGFDIDNEPLEYGLGQSPGLNWGGGGPTDIHAMYQTVGNAIQAVDPGALIIAEGPIALAPLNNFDLTKVASDPVVLNNPNKVVYSAHIYPSAIGGESVDSGAAYVANLNQSFGYLEAQNIAPVWIGELGASLDGTADSAGGNQAEEQAWASTVTSYLNGQDGAQGGPTFSGSQQGISTDWWDWGYNPGQYPDGVLNGDGSINAAQQAVWSQLLYHSTGTPASPPPATPSASWSGGNGTAVSPLPAATPTPTPTATASANDTAIQAGAAATITDANGNVWSITSAGQVAVNGVADTTTANVVQMGYVNGTIWQENSANLWWSKTRPTDEWGPAMGTSVDPLPPLASANDTVVLAGTANTITDANGHVWSITSGAQVAVDGGTDVTTSNVKELAYVNGAVWQENASALWWSKTAPTDQWGPTLGTATSPLPVAVDPNPVLPQIATEGSAIIRVTAADGTQPITSLTTDKTTVEGDEFQLTATGVIQATLGSTATSIAFLGAASVNLVGGSTAATVTAAASSNTFTAGTGALTVTGGPGADNYVFDAGSGPLTITDFSVAKGDTLTVDQSLAASMQEGSDGNDGTLFSVSGSNAIDIRNMANVPVADVTFR